jgi:beta-galactosidase
VSPGSTGRLALPTLPVTNDETWLTVHAVLRDDASWAPAGHEIAWAQARTRAPRAARSTGPAGPAGRAGPANAAGATRTPTRARDRIELGDFTFDATTGRLVRLGDLTLDGPCLDVWRAPIDNDRSFSWDPREPAWRELGLDRVRHRTDAVELADDELVVRTRVAPAGSELGLATTYHWRAGGDGLRLALTVEPEGPWAVALPRLGLRMSLPSELDHVEWYGLGPDESYADSRRAARVGRFRAKVDGLQTPYVFPQENGNRMDTRTLWLRTAQGRGVRVDGDPQFSFTVRRWTTEALAAATHTAELRPTDRVWLNLDVAQNGLGSGSCGPGVLAPYRLDVAPVELDLLFSLVD